MANYEPKTKKNECPFCAIVLGKMETSGIFWENDNFMAFLSIDPNTAGFSCVIPKEHYNSDIMEMNSEILQEFIIAAKTVSKILKNFYPNVGRIGVIMEGTGINHAHIKLIPMHETTDLKWGAWKQYLSDKEFWFDKYEGWICSGGGPMVEPKILSELAKKIIDSQK